MICYKVVDKETRYGSNVAGFLNNLYLGGCSKEEIRSLFAEKLSDERIAPFLIQYKDGTTVKAAKNSVGLLCFKTKEDAMRFILEYELEFRVDIIQVKGKYPRKQRNIISCCMQLLPLASTQYGETEPPEGTIFFGQVYVIPAKDRSI